MTYTVLGPDDFDKIDGTCGQGSMTIPYIRLVNLFGEPMPGDEYKVDAEWNIETDDGTVITIYNWKNGPNYCGSDGIPVPMITEWNIGGHSRKVCDILSDLILSETQKRNNLLVENL